MCHGAFFALLIHGCKKEMSSVRITLRMWLNCVYCILNLPAWWELYFPSLTGFQPGFWCLAGDEVRRWDSILFNNLPKRLNRMSKVYEDYRFIRRDIINREIIYLQVNDDWISRWLRTDILRCNIPRTFLRVVAARRRVELLGGKYPAPLTPFPLIYHPFLSIFSSSPSHFVSSTTQTTFSEL